MNTTLYCSYDLTNLKQFPLALTAMASKGLIIPELF